MQFWNTISKRFIRVHWEFQCFIINVKASCVFIRILLMVWSRVFKLHKHITKCISLILSKYWFKIINDSKIFHPGKKNTVSSSTILRKPIDLIFICKKKNYLSQTNAKLSRFSSKLFNYNAKLSWINSKF